MAVYDDDIFIEGSFRSKAIKEQKNALEDYNDGDEVSLIYIPIKEITYKDTNGFGAYLCENNDDEDAPPTFVVCGTFTDHLDIGQTYKSDGSVALRHGVRQLHIKNITKVTPETKHGIISFMRSLDGMRYQADVIYDKFERRSLDIIKNEPESILKIIKSSYPEQVLGWKKQIEECKNNYGYLSDLIALGMKPAQAKKVYDEYGDSAVIKIQQDPYFLIGKIRGYGFKKCDAIGKDLGIKPNDPERLATGVLYTMQSLMANGSTCIDRCTVISGSIRELSIRMTYREMVDAIKSSADLYMYPYGTDTYTVPMSRIKSDYVRYSSAYSQADKLEARTLIYEITEQDIETALLNLQLSNRIVIENDMLYIKRYYDQEFNIAYYVQQFSKNSKPVPYSTVESMLDIYCKERQIELEDKQKEAVLSVCSHMGGVNIINGAAGCGKTFCIKIALDILQKVYKNNHNTFSKVIIAPTGKAARVAHKAPGVDSYTIHRLLQYRPNEGFFYNAKNHLPYDCIVIDECSMLDTGLAHSLFSAIEYNTKVIMMGDTNQLPSIGAGNVFHDLIVSGNIGVVTLNVIKRQGADSGIVKNARNIIDGESVTTQREFMDSLVVGAKTDAEYVDKIKKYCNSALAKMNIEDVQILSPMKKGVTGTNYLNYIMQETYNKNHDDNRFLKGKFDVKIGDETQTIKLYFRVGDKVINIRNDYKTPWYYVKDGILYQDDTRSGITNGEIGTIVKMIESRDKVGDINQKIIVKFEDKYIVYENEFDDLELAYAITIHRSQGSEWSAIMVVLNKSHKSMIDRNLFYTGITRSKQLSIVISDPDTIRYGVTNTRLSERKTGLVKRLQELTVRPREVAEFQDLLA